MSPHNKCLECAYYTPTQLFELCGHAASRYRANDRDGDLHSISHMRKRACGPDAKLFKSAEELA